MLQALQENSMLPCSKLQSIRKNLKFSLDLHLQSFGRRRKESLPDVSVKFLTVQT